MGKENPSATAMTLDELISAFGRIISDDTLAAYLGMDVRTMRKYADQWGGVEVARGRFVFFEKKIKEAFDNVQPEIQTAKSQNEKRKAMLARVRDGQSRQGKKVVRRRQQGQLQGHAGLGGKREKPAPGSLEERYGGDPHGLDD